MNKLMKFFEYSHLPAHLQQVSKPCGELAKVMDELPESAEKTTGLRKLMEAKDCFVRAVLETTMQETVQEAAERGYKGDVERGSRVHHES